MENKYKLSIVALVYNLEDYLPRCLDALVNQTLDNIEILCVDDGSKDSAPQIVDDYARRYPNLVKAFHKENGGEFTTRNYGLERAQGEYVTFVDTDDYVEPDWAEKLYNAAKENDADMAVCGFERIDLKTGKVVSRDMTGFGNSVKILSADDDFPVFINPAPWNKIYKREKVKDLRFKNFRGFNDMIFLASSYSKVEKIAFVPDVLYHYFLRYDSQIHSVNEQDVNNFKKYLLELKDLYINMNFLSLDLSNIPIENWDDITVFIIPALYVITSIASLRLTSKLTSSKKDKKNNDNLESEETADEKKKDEMSPEEMSAQMSKSMTWFMPMLSISIATVAPLGLALYWLVNNILMIAERIILNKCLKAEEEEENG